MELLLVGFLHPVHGSDHVIAYESRLRDKPAAVADRHFHPVEPRTIRLSVRVTP
jgi:hypothetical protein